MTGPYPHSLIAREGWPFVAIALVIALALSWYGVWVLAIVAWIGFVFVVQFFRDPQRTIPTQPNAVLSPADGRIVKVEQARDPWLDRDALKISVFMNVFNVHSNRSPVDGTVVARWYHPGAFVNAALDKASVENERNALHLLEDTCEDQRSAVQEWIDALDEWPTPGDAPGRRERELLRVRSRDVLEHIERVLTHVRRLESSAEAAVQMHFSALGHRTNDIMRTLTVLTAIFLPLNLITGIFGMNGDNAFRRPGGTSGSCRAARGRLCRGGNILRWRCLSGGRAGRVRCGQHPGRYRQRSLVCASSAGRQSGWGGAGGVARSVSGECGVGIAESVFLGGDRRDR